MARGDSENAVFSSKVDDPNQVLVREDHQSVETIGDGFMVVLGALSYSHNCATVAQGIFDELSKRLILDGRELFLTAGIGIRLFPADGEGPESLLKNADTAMYCAKEARNRHEFFSDVCPAQAANRRSPCAESDHLTPKPGYGSRLRLPGPSGSHDQLLNLAFQSVDAPRRKFNWCPVAPTILLRSSLVLGVTEDGSLGAQWVLMSRSRRQESG